ncbi:MAG TPA: efflux RND transporter periplasmic adaptor subunit [Gammaproteobacteria bacterium]|nr:efflux RND transporter periplasmic adaptor subunit [Gammaproteobacteria bacterium]
MKKRKILLLVLAVALVGALVYVFAIREPSSIVLTGVVTTDDVRVGALTDGRVEELEVDPGDVVEKGQLIARIQPQEPKADVAYYKNLEKASAATVEQAKAQLKFFEEQTREQIHEAEANVAAARAQAKQAEADLENARLEFERQRQLREKQLNSQQQLDAARTMYESAEARYESLVKQVQAAEAALAVAKANEQQIGARKAELESAGEQLAAAGAQTEKAEVRLAYTEIRAPIAGLVDVRAALEGEVVTPGQTIVTLIDPDDLWVRADVEESYIDRVRLGDSLAVRLPSGATRECKVFFRGADADYATQRDVSRTKRDIKTFEIRLRCDNRDRSLALGMSAYVTLPLAS